MLFRPQSPQQALSEAERVALWCVRRLFRNDRESCGLGVLAMPFPRDGTLGALEAAFERALGLLSASRRRALHIGLPVSERVNEVEVYCLDAIAAAQSDDGPGVRRALRAVFSHVGVLEGFAHGFALLGASLGAMGWWLDWSVAPASGTGIAFGGALPSLRADCPHLAMLARWGRGEGVSF